MFHFFYFATPRWLVLVLLVSLLGTTACTNADTDDGTIDSTKGKGSTSSIAPAQPAPLQVSMFLELSRGMSGFMPVNPTNKQPTKFQTYISQLASHTRSSTAVVDTQFLLALQEPRTTTTILTHTTYNHFRDVVQGDTHEAAMGTELPDILEKILALPKAADRVNVIVSDFIYGPLNKSAAGLMQSRVADALLTVRKQHLAVVVLADTSRFTGIFYPAVKTPHREVRVAGQTMPYYVWVIGPPTAVSRFLNEVAPSNTTQQAFFGLALPKVNYAAILTQVSPNSSLAPSGDGSVSFTTGQPSTELEVSDVDQGVEFTVALDLSALPAAWREPSFLAQHLQVQLNGGAVRILPKSVQTAKDVVGLSGYTHTLRLRLTALPKEAVALQLSLPAPETPAWVGAWTTQDDNQPNNPPRTYRLGEIMAGVREVFPTPLPPVFTTQFTLTQN